MADVFCRATGKVCHSRRAAERAAKVQARQARRLHRLEAYECEHADDHPEGAGRWHVGHKIGSGRPRPRR